MNDLVLPGSERSANYSEAGGPFVLRVWLRPPTPWSLWYSVRGAHSCWNHYKWWWERMSRHAAHEKTMVIFLVPDKGRLRNW